MHHKGLNFVVLIINLTSFWESKIWFFWYSNNEFELPTGWTLKYLIHNQNCNPFQFCETWFNTNLFSLLSWQVQWNRVCRVCKLVSTTPAWELVKITKSWLGKIESNYRDWCFIMVRPKLASEFEFPASILQGRTA